MGYSPECCKESDMTEATEHTSTDVSYTYSLITSQYIHISNHYAVHIKLMQCYMSVISQKNWKKCSRNFKNQLKIVNIKCILSKGNVNIKFEREHKR